MDSFICVKSYIGKNMMGSKVEIQAGSLLERKGNYIFWNNVPLCTWRSQIAKTYMVWNDNFERRARALKIILNENRISYWNEQVALRDENGDKVTSQTVQFSGRYSPKEIAYIKEHYPSLLENADGLHFNDFFYVGSNIDTLESLAEYLS